MKKLIKFYNDLINQVIFSFFISGPNFNLRRSQTGNPVSEYTETFHLCKSIGNVLKIEAVKYNIQSDS